MAPVQAQTKHLYRIEKNKDDRYIIHWSEDGKKWEWTGFGNWATYDEAKAYLDGNNKGGQLVSGKEAFPDAEEDEAVQEDTVRGN